MRDAQASEKFAVAGDVYAFLATGEETGGLYSLVEASVPSGGGPPPHRQGDTELFYVLSGEVTFTVAGESVTAGAGSHVRVEPGVAHAFRNDSDGPARMLIQTLPAGLDAYFREVGVAVGSMDDSVPVTPEQIAKLKAAAPAYGIEILA